VVGVEQFSRYKGYSDTFKFAGRYTDTVDVDSSGRKMTSVVAMDAIRFTNSNDQFSIRNLDRELNKAFVAFQNRHVDRLQAIATGNWGCGAFGGDPRVKLLLQLMAAAEAGRDVVYFTFGDSTLVKDGGEMYKFLVKGKVSVGCLYRLITEFGRSGRELEGEELFRWIYQYHKTSSSEDKDVDAYEVETDSEKEDLRGGMEDNIQGATRKLVTENIEIQPEPSDSDKWLNDQMEYFEKKIEKKDGSKELKNGGFFAALDKMEKGELKTQKNGLICPIEASLGLATDANVSLRTNGQDQVNRTNRDKQSDESTPKKCSQSQSKLTDFFQAK